MATSPEFIAVYAPEVLPPHDIIQQCSVCGKDVVIHPQGQVILAANPALVIYCHPCADLAFENPPTIPKELTGAVTE